MRCLIVDDSAEFRAVATALLERAGIAVVATASNLADAVRLCGELRPDVVLVDVDLGQDNGFDVAKELRDPVVPEPPVVILVSTYSEQDFEDLIAVSPAAGFVPKFALSVPAIRGLVTKATAGAARPVNEPPGR